MPDARIFFCRFKAFAFDCVQMKDLRTLHIFYIPQDTCQVFYIVSVYWTEVADVHPLEDVLLLGCH